MKIAVASSDGKHVDLHLGKAKNLMIYEFDGEKSQLVDERGVHIDKDARHQWQKPLEACRDCEVVIAVQAGMKAKIGFKNAGIKIMEGQGTVEEVLEKYKKHYNFMKNPI